MMNNKKASVVNNPISREIEIPDFLKRERTVKEERIISCIKISLLLIVGFGIGMLVGRI